ncbi:hypothetical protein V8G54_010111 [Vigna mungo]|uniref:Uncharacterized protein n=1 Tax=Vigna mungo TaxID=3915 RepID=A0AAQ3NW25_VIGMU
MVDSGRKWEPLFFSFCDPIIIPPALQTETMEAGKHQSPSVTANRIDIIAGAAAGGVIDYAVVFAAQLRSSISVEHCTLPPRQRASSALPPSSSLLECVGLPLLPASLAPSTIFFGANITSPASFSHHRRRCQRFCQCLHRRSSLLHASLTIFYECDTKAFLGFFSLQCRCH